MGMCELYDNSLRKRDSAVAELGRSTEGGILHKTTLPASR